MTEISDDVRAGVLGALARGMSFDYAARADGIRVAEAEQIAKDAGWPNATMVYAEYRRLKDIPATGLPVAGLAGRPGVDTTRAGEPDVVRRPRQPLKPRPDLSVARVASVLNSTRSPIAGPVPAPGQPVPADEPVEATEGPFQCHHERCGHIDEEDCSQECDDEDQGWAERHDLDDDPDEDCCDVPADVGARHGCPPDDDRGQVEQEYRGEVVQAGPPPEHLEPLADYVARVELDTTQIVSAQAIEPEATVAERERTWAMLNSELDPADWPDAPDVIGDTGVIYVCSVCGDPTESEPCRQHQPGAYSRMDDEDELIASEEVDLIPVDQPLVQVARPLPPATDSPTEPAPDLEREPDAPTPVAPRPRQLPCEVCGIGVLTSYVEKTGKQRHGHHSEGS